nr:phage Gp37/Gp68 family protein [Burkholderia cenocepacia]
MSENTKIEWCDHTFNPWEGCQKVGPGCDNCYAEARNARFGGGTAVNWGPGAPRRRTSAANWRGRSHGKRCIPSSSPRTADASACSARRSRMCSTMPSRTHGARTCSI